MKSYTDIEQSKKLAEILPFASADMFFIVTGNREIIRINDNIKDYNCWDTYPAWSLASLLKYLSEINPQLYTPVLFSSEGKWILQFVEYGHRNICNVNCDNPIDTCYVTILKLHELNLI